MIKITHSELVGLNDKKTQHFCCASFAFPLAKRPSSVKLMSCNRTDSCTAAGYKLVFFGDLASRCFPELRFVRMLAAPFHPCG